MQVISRSEFNFAISESTAHDYPHDGIDVLEQARAAGVGHLNLDGTVIRTDRVGAPGPNGADLWWSGKHKQHGGNIQVLSTPDGRPLWTPRVRPTFGPGTCQAHLVSCQRTMEG